MTDPHNEIDAIKANVVPEAKDLRRATALLIAADPMAFNAQAVGEVIAEVKATDRRITQLLTGMAVLAYQSPDLGTSDGQQALRNSWKHYRKMEQENTQ